MIRKIAKRQQQEGGGGAWDLDPCHGPSLQGLAAWLLGAGCVKGICRRRTLKSHTKHRVEKSAHRWVPRLSTSVSPWGTAVQLQIRWNCMTLGGSFEPFLISVSRL